MYIICAFKWSHCKDISSLVIPPGIMLANPTSKHNFATNHRLSIDMTVYKRSWSQMSEKITSLVTDIGQ